MKSQAQSERDLAAQLICSTRASLPTTFPTFPDDVLQDIQAIDVAFTGFQRDW